MNKQELHAELVPHGTLDYEELRALGVHPDELIVFSSNINPYGPPDSVTQALREACEPDILARYPDRLSLDLRDGLADHYQIEPSSIIVGNGTSDIMWLIGLVFLRGRRVAILGPTFGEYLNVARMMESDVQFVSFPGWRQEGEGYRQASTTIQETMQQLRQARPEVVFICNPNNPTGLSMSPTALAQLVTAAPDALWIIDEAYADFADEPVSSINQMDDTNHLILRSMTKDFALGGLRLGYVVGPPALIAQLQTVQPPWNVNALAQIAGEACLGELAWRRRTLRQLRQECQRLQEQMHACGYAPLPTELSYFLTPVSNGESVRRALLAKRLMVRDCASFGLPGYIRIAVRRPEENDQLAAELKKIADWAALPAALPVEELDTLPA